MQIIKKYNKFFFNLNFFFFNVTCLLVEKFCIKYISKYTFNILNSNVSKKSNLKFFLIIKSFKQLNILKFKSFIDINAVDNLYNTTSLLNRFEIQYLLLSLIKNIRLILITNWNFGMFIQTVSTLFSGANWAEREIFDMFGILFINHKDLRRILSDYGFEGFPNQKNFPVYGFKELFYSEEINSVIYSNLSLTQNYRNFFLSNTW